LSLTPAARKWSAIIDRYEASGLKVRAFAEANDLNQSTLNSWRSKLGRTGNNPKQRFTELVVYGSEENSNSSLVLNVPRYHVQITINNATDLSLVKKVLKALC